MRFMRVSASLFSFQQLSRFGSVAALYADTSALSSREGHGRHPPEHGADRLSRAEDLPRAPLGAGRGQAASLNEVAGIAIRQRAY